MAETLTEHFGLTKPDPGGSTDTWGQSLNDNFDALDGALQTVSSTAGAALVKTQNLNDVASKSAARTNLGVAIGSDVQGHHANLDQLAGLSLTTNKLAYANGTGTLALADFSAAGRALIDDADAGAMRQTLGVRPGVEVQAYSGNLATIAGGISSDGLTFLQAGNFSAMASLLGVATGSGSQAYSAILTALAGLSLAADRLVYATGSSAFATTDLTSLARSLLDDSTQGAMQTTLGLRPGVEVQAYHANLAALAGLTLAANKLVYGNGSGSLALADLTSAGRDLIAGASASDQRTSLGLGGAAVKNTGTSGDTIPKCNTANSFDQAQSLPAGSTYNGMRMAHVASGGSTASGRISWGSGDAGSLAEGEIYLRHA